MVDTKIRLIIFFAAKDVLYSQQKQDLELTVAQIMNSLLPNSDLNWRKKGKPLDHDFMWFCFDNNLFIHHNNSESEVAQSCPTLCDPMDCSLPGSSVHGIFQTRVLEWIAISFSRGSSRPRNWTQVSLIAGRCFYHLSHQGSYDKPRQHIKQQNYHFADKCPSSGFSSSHVWMWELDQKEDWAPKNWCFGTVVLVKTLKSPLDCKEIKPVHPKGNQSWIVSGRTDAEAEAPILWPPDTKNWLTGTDPNSGKDWGQEEKGDDSKWDGWMAS